ncbi:MAG: hypothetical protein KDC52_06035, partial [Ignavibacteriae bacterium]|nr:hypothetical protein [Ignavibacteriota bacterium]
TLFGNRDLVGELVLEGPGISWIREVQMNGKKLKPEIDEYRTIIRYNHACQKGMKVRLGL